MNCGSVGFLMNAGMMGAMIYLPFFVQGVEGVSPTNSGFINMPMSLAMIVLSTLVGRWISKSGKYKRYALIGMPFMVAAMIIMAFMSNIAMAALQSINRDAAERTKRFPDGCILKRYGAATYRSTACSVP